MVLKYVCVLRVLRVTGTRPLTAALLVAVVQAVVGAVTSGPLGDAAVVCLAGELGVVTLVVWTHWKKEADVRRGAENPAGEGVC